MLLAAALANAADISGTVVIQRRLTKPKVTVPLTAYSRGTAVNVNTDAASDPLSAERARVVIYVEGAGRPEPRTGVLEQRNRQFLPELLVLPVGSTVSFPNLDPIFHNVFSLSKPRTFDLGNYPKNQTRTVTFTKPGVVFVNCHLHPNMAAAIVITPNQWASKADPDGRFTLPDLPAGTYTVTAWHRVAGFVHQTVRVGSESPTPIKFIIPLPDPEPVHTAHR
jgi:plastocyanin